MKLKFSKKVKISDPLVKKRKRKIPFVVVLVVVIFLVQIFFAIGSLSSGSKITELENEAKVLTEENKDIKYQIMKTSSLTSISEKVNDLGFSKPTNMIYINDSSSLAKLP